MAEQPTTQVVLPKLPSTTKPIDVTGPTLNGGRTHTQTHTHQAGYTCACGSLAKERSVTHNHIGGSEPHHHSNSEELLVGKDIKLALSPTGAEARA